MALPIFVYLLLDFEQWLHWEFLFFHSYRKCLPICSKVLLIILKGMLFRSSNRVKDFIVTNRRDGSYPNIKHIWKIYGLTSPCFTQKHCPCCHPYLPAKTKTGISISKLHLALSWKGHYWGSWIRLWRHRVTAYLRCFTWLLTCMSAFTAHFYCNPPERSFTNVPAFFFQPQISVVTWTAQDC